MLRRRKKAGMRVFSLSRSRCCCCCCCLFALFQFYLTWVCTFFLSCASQPLLLRLSHVNCIVVCVRVFVSVRLPPSLSSSLSCCSRCVCVCVRQKLADFLGVFAVIAWYSVNVWIARWMPDRFYACGCECNAICTQHPIRLPNKFRLMYFGLYFFCCFVASSFRSTNIFIVAADVHFILWLFVSSQFFFPVCVSDAHLSVAQAIAVLFTSRECTDFRTVLNMKSISISGKTAALALFHSFDPMHLHIYVGVFLQVRFVKIYFV